jgi:hypothetical protein
VKAGLTRRGRPGAAWAPQPHVRRALEATNLTRLLPIYDTIAAVVDRS